MEGSIAEVHKNYGIINSKNNGRNVKFMFYIFPDMVNNGVYRISEKVTFNIVNQQVRGSKLFIACHVKPLQNSEIKQYKIKKNEKIKDYDHYIYKSFFQIEDDESLLESLITADERFKEFTLKWILFLEKDIRKIIVDLAGKYKIDSTSIYDVLDNAKETKSIHKHLLKALGSNYKFKPEFNFLTIKRKNMNDDINFEVVDAPLSLYLEETTLGELSSIVKVLYLSIFNNINEKQDEKFNFLKQTLEMFNDLSIIRNTAAHGRPLIPIILDDNYAPNDLYDLSSADPNFNSGINVTKWKLFQPIRYITRQLTKTGIAPNYYGGLQSTGLYTAKFILSNPARRSFFSYAYILGFYFKFIDKSRLNEFLADLKQFVPVENDDLKRVNEYLFGNYPKNAPVFKQFIKFLYPLLDGTFWIIVHNGILMEKN